MTSFVGIYPSLDFLGGFYLKSSVCDLPVAALQVD